MRIYKVDYKAESPIIVAKPSISNLFNHYSNYILGSTIRGAILTSLLREGVNVEDEMSKPSIVFHPAFPIINDQLYKPTHVLVYKCKICKKDPYNLLNPYELDLCKFQEQLREKIPIKCKNEHPFALKPIGGELISINNGKINKYEPKYGIFDSVGINRVTGSSEINLIYTYIASLQEHYQGLIVTNDLCKIEVEKLNGNEVFIGKGINRGFGIVKLKIKEISKDDVIKRYKIKDTIVLKAISPIFNLNIKDNGLITDTEFKIKGNICKVLSNGYTNVSGFSIVSNTAKVKLYALREGSLILINNKNINDDDLANIELNGIGHFSCSGLNIVEVLNNDLPY